MGSRVSGVCALVPQEGKTALHEAVKNGHTVVVEALLAHGANLEAETKVCNRALMCPCLLLPLPRTGGAAVTHSQSHEWSSACACAAEWKHNCALGGQEWPLSIDRLTHRAWHQPRGPKQGVHASLERDARCRCRSRTTGGAVMMDLRVRDACAVVPQYGRTALHEAALKDNTAVIEALFAHGANIKAKDNVC